MAVLRNNFQTTWWEIFLLDCYKYTEIRAYDIKNQALHEKHV